jgi:hypothetical protein
MKFKKSFFEKHKPISNNSQLDELVDATGSPIEGDFNPSYKDIQTGPYPKTYDDQSDYVKGISTTTDDMANYRQPNSWWTMFYGYGGTNYSHGRRGSIAETELSEELVVKNGDFEIVEKKEDELVKRFEKIRDIISKSDLDTETKNKINNIINDSEI